MLTVLYRFIFNIKIILMVIDMLKIFLFVMFFSFSVFGEEVHRAVIDLRIGDVKKFENSVLKGLSFVIQSYRNKLQDLKVVVVAHGDSYKFFLKNLEKTPYRHDAELLKRQKDIKERLENLVKLYGVRFEICEAGMKSRNLEISNLYPFVKPVPTALNAVIEWQERGYHYMLFQ